eukprot:3688896-Rhodomonas_salina.1
MLCRLAAASELRGRVRTRAGDVGHRGHDLHAGAAVDHGLDRSALREARAGRHLPPLPRLER